MMATVHSQRIRGGKTQGSELAMTSYDRLPAESLPSHPTDDQEALR
jgi:hypothetical protein